mmetsp:Transcript_44915/g.103806  ORF Transcript_44915/g.103806 Transcript_44915/m.103806 type:complete len:252 (-) Transcript_44915:913-1668(-)
MLIVLFSDWHGCTLASLHGCTGRAPVHDRVAGCGLLGKLRFLADMLRRHACSWCTLLRGHIARALLGAFCHCAHCNVGGGHLRSLLWVHGVCVPAHPETDAGGRHASSVLQSLRYHHGCGVCHGLPDVALPQPLGSALPHARFDHGDHLPYHGGGPENASLLQRRRLRAWMVVEGTAPLGSTQVLQPLFQCLRGPHECIQLLRRAFQSYTGAHEQSTGARRMVGDCFVCLDLHLWFPVFWRRHSGQHSAGL